MDVTQQDFCPGRFGIRDLDILDDNLQRSFRLGVQNNKVLFLHEVGKLSVVQLDGVKGRSFLDLEGERILLIGGKV